MNVDVEGMGRRARYLGCCACSTHSSSHAQEHRPILPQNNNPFLSQLYREEKTAKRSRYPSEFMMLSNSSGLLARSKDDIQEPPGGIHPEAWVAPPCICQ
jgi:hypothetical protein